ncbi:MAG: MDR family MFS transporter [Dehalococcoidia bacterium]
MTDRQKFILLNALMMCMLVGALDHSVMATAVPRILSDLGGFHLLPWFFTTYLLASTVFVSIVGKLSDMFGRKPFLLAGIAVFSVASIACGMAPSMLALIVARAVQGMGGGIIFACVFATLYDMYTPLERMKYVGYFTSIFTVASLMGPLVGGVLTDGPGWRWAFYINIPVGIVAAVLVQYLMPMTRREARLADVDFLGAGLLAGAIVSFMLALVWAGERYGIIAAPTLGLLGLAIALGAGFIAQERRHPEAILPLFLFRNRQFVHANLIIMAVGGGIFSSVQFIPTFVQTALGEPATLSGIVVTPQSVLSSIAGVLVGRQVAKTGLYKRFVVTGAVLMLAGSAPMLLLTTDSSALPIAVYMSIVGFGIGSVMPVMSTIVQNSVPQELMGVASSARQFFMFTVQVFAVAVLGLLFTTGYARAFSAAEVDRAALPAGVYERFLDPTLALDEAVFAGIRDEVLRQPEGQRILDATIRAQRESVTAATHLLFGVVTAVAALLVVLAVTLREVPLRGSFSPADAKDEEREAAGEEPAADVAPVPGA